MFTSCNFRPEVWAAAQAAVRVGRMVQQNTWSHEARNKKHATWGTSSVSESDTGSQKEITSELARAFPDALFLAEEDDPDIRRADPASPDFWTSTVFGIDPIDGSTENAHGLPNWCTSNGVMMNGSHVGGAIYAPDVRGGQLFVADIDRGTFLWEYGKYDPQSVNVAPKRDKPIIKLGLDVQRKNNYAGFITALPKHLKPRGIAPSGALGLAEVAAGRVDAIVQSPQMPWDWFAGFPMVLASDGVFRGFRVEDGRVVRTSILGASSYDAKEQSLGFIAGNRELVDELFGILTETYKEK